MHQHKQAEIETHPYAHFINQKVRQFKVTSTENRRAKIILSPPPPPHTQEDFSYEHRDRQARGESMKTAHALVKTPRTGHEMSCGLSAVPQTHISALPSLKPVFAGLLRPHRGANFSRRQVFSEVVELWDLSFTDISRLPIITQNPIADNGRHGQSQNNRSRRFKRRDPTAVPTVEEDQGNLSN